MKEQMRQLKSEGKTYSEIAEILNCSKSTVCYYLGINQKDKSKIRLKVNRSNHHPFVSKIRAFIKEANTDKTKSNPLRKYHKLIYDKIKSFFFDTINKMQTKPTFTVEDVINKFGENPTCYLTGEPIDISKPKTYAFDHITPRSRGGENTLENLGLTTKLANAAKTDMTYEEFIKFCQRIVDHNQK